MIDAYVGRNRKLYLKPSDPEGEEELRDFLQNLKQLGLEAIDIETEMPEAQYQQYKQQSRSGEYSGSRSFGFGAQANRYPMPPDFSPQMHYYPPVILPLWFQQGGGGSDGGSGGSGGGGNGGGQGGGSGGGQGGTQSIFDNVERSERGRGGSRSEFENPRDTGGRDFPRR